MFNQPRQNVAQHFLNRNNDVLNTLFWWRKSWARAQVSLYLGSNKNMSGQKNASLPLSKSLDMFAKDVLFTACISLRDCKQSSDALTTRHHWTRLDNRTVRENNAE